MFSQGEMEVLSEISNGNDSIRHISERTGKSIPQIYKIASTLHSKDVAHLCDGKIIPERKTYVTLLLDILRTSNAAALSGNALELLKEFEESRTVAEVAKRTGLHQTSVSRRIRKMVAVGLIWKSGSKYVINDKLMPGLRPMADAYAEYNKANDMRTPPGSKIYHATKSLIIFADGRGDDFTKTAFSKYEEYGLKFYPGTYYCVSPPMDVTLRDAFIHSLLILETAKEWRLKMMALILYVKFKDELHDITHPIKDDMDRVLKGERIKGWVKLAEMQERADMYGVLLR
ncbi:MAG: MarR family transcriptional regulator [Candidatus Methanoplasma sp.]|jgi:hypothetical protein|nr:MarR family transcriptional regulator [Candidatus Methanoplasma sp.]